MVCIVVSHIFIAIRFCAIKSKFCFGIVVGKSGNIITFARITKNLNQVAVLPGEGGVGAGGVVNDFGVFVHKALEGAGEGAGLMVILLARGKHQGENCQ